MISLDNIENQMVVAVDEISREVQKQVQGQVQTAKTYLSKRVFKKVQNPIQKAATFGAYVITSARLVKDPGQLDLVFKLVEKTWEPKYVQQMIDALDDAAQVRAALKYKPRLEIPEIEELQKMPKGTLGREFAEFVLSRKIDPKDLPKIKAQNQHEYFLAHLYETHDLWHLITGFPTDVAGELGLQSFYLAQMPSRVANLLLALGLLNAFIFDFDDYEPRMQNIVKGWIMGRKAKAVFGVDWTELWSIKLSEIRKDLGVDVKIKVA